MRNLRILVGLAALGAGVFGAHWYLSHSEYARLRAERDRLERQRQELIQIAERLKSERRVADVIIIGQPKDDHGEITQTEFEFVEFDQDGHALPTRHFCVPGRVLYFDALVIKFDEDLVAAGDPLRGKSVMLFRRIFSEDIAPKDGPLIDPNGSIPSVFRVNPAPSEFEQRIWSQFWTYVANPKAAAKEGIRVAQGEAVYAPVTAGQRWSLTLENDGGLNLTLLAPAGEAVGQARSASSSRDAKQL